MNKRILNIAIAAAFLVTGASATAQVVQQKVGDNPMTINPNAVLDVESANKGLLLPRVALESTNSFAPLTAHEEGMTVYNTATAGTDDTAVTPGYYYNDGTKWVRLADAADIKTEPWFDQETNEEATANTDDIYQMGSVAIGKNAVQTGAALDVAGAVRAGTNHTGTVGLNSVVFGTANEASGDMSTAMGQGTTASESYSTAIGNNTTASGFASVAIGNNTTASGPSSTAMGVATRASGDTSTAMGNVSLASGDTSTAMGQGTTASGSHSTAMGASTKAGGYASTAMGYGTEASGNESTAMGYLTKASGSFSTAMGERTVASSTQETTIGSYNAITTSNNTITDALFQVGNGNNATRNNAVTVLKNAHTAIGVAGVDEAAKPTELLDLGGTATAGNGGLKIRNINSAAYTGDVTTDKLVVADADGVLKTVDQSSLMTEPWFDQATNTKATANTDDIYQMGSVAIGKNAVQTGATLDVVGAVRGGANNTGAAGLNSVAFGTVNEASGVASAALGAFNIASGAASIAFGNRNTSSGEASVAMGTSTKANGQGAFAAGVATEANQNGAFAVGMQTKATNTGAFAAGNSTIASSSNETSIGSYNAIITSNNTTTDALFQVGNGTSVNRNNAVTILKNAHTAIGVSGTDNAANPTELLDLGGTATAGNGGLKIRNINSAAYAGNAVTDKVVVADANGVLKTVNATALVPAYVEPWRTISPDAPATANDQNIYQMGKVSIGKRQTNAQLSIYDAAGTSNNTPLYIENVSKNDPNVKPWFAYRNNLGLGSWSSLSLAGDQAFVFSVDADPSSFSRNALEFIPHSSAGGATPFGFKITDQGMFSFNAQYPTETMDLGRGTMRIRQLPKNGAVNAIYTTPAGNASVPETVPNVDDLINKTQTFTATRTVVADKNGVLGYVDGLPAGGSAAMPKFFYMPSIIVPTSEDQLNATGSGQVTGDSFDDTTREGTINLHGRYSAQFGTPMVSNAGATTTLPVLPATELDYHITWYDTNVFEMVTVDDNGVMTYEVKDNADVTTGSFMNIVFTVKE